MNDGLPRLDVLADPIGGNYADPLIMRRFAGSPPMSPTYNESGIKVLHIPDLDIWTSCITLVSCLRIIKRWMDHHPEAVPLTVMMEPKTAGSLGEMQGGAKVIPWDNATLLDGLDDEIRRVFGPAQLITPDDIRREGDTLEGSVLGRGWPDLESARGRIMFLMDNALPDPIRDAYIDGRPNLEGRVLFTNAPIGDPDCAFQKVCPFPSRDFPPFAAWLSTFACPSSSRRLGD